jgi:hypothetical protein
MPRTLRRHQTLNYRRGQPSRLYPFSPGTDIGGSGFQTATVPTSAYAPYWHQSSKHSLMRYGASGQTEVSHVIRYQDFRA